MSLGGASSTAKHRGCRAYIPYSESGIGGGLSKDVPPNRGGSPGSGLPQVLVERSNGHTGGTKGLQIHHVSLGTTDAPFLAISSLQRLVKDKMADPNITEVEKLVCSTIKHDTYVDDITTGGKDVNEALAVYEGMTSMLGAAGFKIRKWATNSKELLQHIPAEECAPTKEIIERAGPTTISEATSSLGVRWDPQTDDIVYDCYG